MSKALLILIVGLATSLHLNAQEARDTSPWILGSVDIEGRSYPYRLLTPPKSEPDTRYPLLVFLHGAGSRGDDNSRHLKHLPAWLAENRDRWPGYVLAPQCPRGQRWVEVDWSATESIPQAEPSPAMRPVLASLAETLKDHPIDHDRISLTGLSMGGFGCWDLAARHPEWFSAAAPICGGGDERRAAQLTGIPLFVVHGDADRAVPVSRSRKMVAAIRQAGGTPRYDEIAKGGHNVWTEAYRGTELLPWFLESRRSNLENGVPALAALSALARKRRPDECVAFLGDSITQAGARPGGYVDLVTNALADLKPKVTAIPAGISGNRVPDLLARLDEDVLSKKPSLVFVYIGINDVWHSTRGKGTPIEEFESGLHALLQRIKKSGAEVILTTPTVIGEKTDGSNELDPMLESFSAVSRRVAEKEDVVLHDLRRATLEHLRVFNAAGAEEGVLTTDGVHLNDAGNRFLAQQAALAIAEAWQRRP